MVFGTLGTIQRLDSDISVKSDITYLKAIRIFKPNL